MSSSRCFLPKSARLLKSAEYRRVYQEGNKFAGPLFAAFYRRAEAGCPFRAGYTTPRAVGKAVARNRMKRRLREAVRLEMGSVEAGWEVVFNPRRGVLEADFPRLTAEVRRLFAVMRRRSQDS